MITDTAAEMDFILIENARKMTVSERLTQMRRLSSLTAQMSKRAIARANPQFTNAEVDVMFVELHYGRELATHYREYLKHHPCKLPT